MRRFFDLPTHAAHRLPVIDAARSGSPSGSKLGSSAAGSGSALVRPAGRKLVGFVTQQERRTKSLDASSPVRRNPSVPGWLQRVQERY